MAMLALLFATAVISAPAVSRGFHSISHVAAPVAAGEHHHHGEDGHVTFHGEHRDVAPDSDEALGGKSGHSHMASTAFDMAPQGSSVVPRAQLKPMPKLPPADTPALETLGWSPQKRPPRTT